MTLGRVKTKALLVPCILKIVRRLGKCNVEGDERDCSELELKCTIVRSSFNELKWPNHCSYLNKSAQLTPGNGRFIHICQCQRTPSTANETAY